MADWKQFWGPGDTGSLEGQVRFQGGDLLAKCAADPEQLTPDDFRLRPDSAGYRAGKDGKDLGADVDLVGPGPAYERWKKTPEYQQWLKDTGAGEEVTNRSPSSSASRPTEVRRQHEKRPVRSLPPSKPLTGPAPPRRSVCAPGTMSLHCIADRSRKGDSHVVPELSSSP